MRIINLQKKLSLLFTIGFISIGLICGLFFLYILKRYIDPFIISKQILLGATFSLLMGAAGTYFFSGWLVSLLLFPLQNIITKVNEINIYKNIDLLEEPKNKGEFKELIASFNRMLLRIKEQYESQNAFFASASHELRTPLTIMLTRLQIFSQNHTNSEEMQNLYTEQIKDVHRLIDMVNDFLLMGEINNNNIQLSHNECNLSDIILNHISKYKQKTTERNTPFKLTYSPIEADYMVIADTNMLTIIINNLINNAVKYSKVDTTIQVTLTKRDDKTIITINNQIREDINPQITDIKNKFYHSKPLHGEGSGLGLWICKQLADIQDIELFFSIKDNLLFEANLII